MLADIARLLGIDHIKRVPVVRDGLIVDIANRADLLDVVAARQKSDAVAPKAALSGFLAGPFSKSHHPARGNRAAQHPGR